MNIPDTMIDSRNGLQYVFFFCGGKSIMRLFYKEKEEHANLHSDSMASESV